MKLRRAQCIVPTGPETGGHGKASRVVGMQKTGEGGSVDLQSSSRVSLGNAKQGGAVCLGLSNSGRLHRL